MTLSQMESLRDRLSASSHIPKKEGAKNITFFLSLQNGHPQTAFELSELYSYRTMAHENGVWARQMRAHGDRAGPAARWLGRRAWLGLMHPFLREWGRARVPSHAPFHVWGGVPAYNTILREWGRARCGVPSRTPFPHVRGGVSACNTLPREWGRVGLGVACPRVPHAYVAARPRGKGRPGGSRARMPPFCEWGGVDKREGARVTRSGGVECPHTPPVRANGAVEGQGQLRVEERSAPVPPSTRMGKGGAGGSRAPFLRIQGGATKRE
ncbi:hypothetical protein EDB89DRAFT_1906211 [Lactarius sanguifluus]|nr:hypothetical protein EDB89DRAFT_1906211 [Lactarius sanguifluus]